jgi:hypothetical protein
MFNYLRSQFGLLETTSRLEVAIVTFMMALLLPAFGFAWLVDRLRPNT